MAKRKRNETLSQDDPQSREPSSAGRDTFNREGPATGSRRDSDSSSVDNQGDRGRNPGVGHEEP
jgi:hypothetical protein